MSASWILTQSGKQFDLLAPEADMVVMDEIAHALANICRFAGYTQTHYSVGQHSVLASHWYRGGTRFTRCCMMPPRPTSATW